MKLALAIYLVHFVHMLLGLPIEGIEQALISVYATK